MTTLLEKETFLILSHKCLIMLYVYRYTCSCRAVSPNSESKGELLIGEDSVFFVADEAISDANYTQVGRSVDTFFGIILVIL